MSLLGLLGKGFGHASGGGPSCDYPSTSNVRTGINYANGSMTGVLSLPTQGNVRIGVGYGANGTEFTGTYNPSSGGGGPIPDGTTRFAHSPANVLRYILIQAAKATNPNDNNPWPCYWSIEPNEPDNCLTVYDTNSIEQGRAHVSGQVLEHYGAQIRLRSLEAREGFNKLNDIMIFLDEEFYHETVTVETATYFAQAVSRTGGINQLGQETSKSKRFVFTLNVTFPLTRIS